MAPRPPIFCLQLFVLLVHLQGSLATTYNVPFLIDDMTSPEAQQALSVALYAVHQTNASWSALGSPDSLNVTVVYRNNTLDEALSFLAYAADSSTLAVAMGSEALLDAVFPLVRHSQIPFLSYDVESSTYDTTNSAFLSAALPLSFSASALRGLLAAHNWGRVAVVYGTDSYSSSLVQAITQEMPDFDLGLFEFSANDSTAAIQYIMTKSYNVIVMALPNPSDASAVLEAAEAMPFLLSAYQGAGGREWIWLNTLSQSTIPALLPLGSIVFNSPVATAANVSAFTTNVLQAIQDQNSYPMTGAGSSLLPESLLAYDLITTLAQAIVKANSTYGTVNQANVVSTLRNNAFWGYSGAISFGTRGFATQGLREFAVVTNVSQATTFGSYDGTSITLNYNPWNVSGLVNPNMTHYGVSFSVSWLIPGRSLAYLLQNAYLPYFMYRLNNLGYLPENVMFDAIWPDNGNIPPTASANCANLKGYGFVSVIGDLTTAVTEVLADALAPTHTPLVGPASASPALSDKTNYPYFLRAVPAGVGEGLAMLALAQNYGWTEINILYTSDDFSSAMNGVIVTGALSMNITIVNSIQLPVGLTDYTSYLTDFFAAKPRILFNLVDSTSMPTLLGNMAHNNFSAIATVCSQVLYALTVSDYTTQYGYSAAVTEGWIVVNVPAGRGAKWDALVADINALNPLYYPYFPHIISSIVSIQSIWTSFEVVADAVSRCHLMAGCDPRNGAQLLPVYYSTNLSVVSGTFTFDSNGDRNAFFDLFNIRGGIQQLIGTYSPSAGIVDLNFSSVVWPDGSSTAPLAVLPKTLKWLEWDSAAGIVLTIFAMIGILGALAMFVVFYVERTSVVINAATWQFLLLMLVGTMIGNGSVLLWIGYPKAYLCGLRAWFPPLAFVLIVAPLLAKTWRLFKIFSLQDFKVQPIYLSRLIVIVCVLTVIQVIICIVWTALGSTGVILVPDPSDSTQVYVVCDSNLADQVCAYVTYGYVGFLVLLTCYIAFRVRKLPKDFNESIWIGRTIYNTALFAVLIIILGYSLSKYKTTVLILICVCTLAICYGSIILMMAPKIWELWRHPERRSSSQAASRRTTSNGSSAKAPLSSNGNNPSKTRDFSRKKNNASSTRDGDSPKANNGQKAESVASSVPAYTQRHDYSRRSQRPDEL